MICYAMVSLSKCFIYAYGHASYAYLHVPCLTLHHFAGRLQLLDRLHAGLQLYWTVRQSLPSGLHLPGQLHAFPWNTPT